MNEKIRWVSPTLRLNVLRPILTVLIIVPLILSGCIFEHARYKNIDSIIEDSGEGYKTVTVTTERFSFSFEYSNFYELTRPEKSDLNWEVPSVYTDLRVPEAKVDVVLPSGKDDVRTASATFTPASIGIGIFDSSRNGERASYNATHFMNFQLEREASWDNFKLLERSPVTISGIDGEYAAWEVDWVGLFPKTDGDPPLEYRWYAVFDYKGQIWRIDGISSGPEYRDRIDSDFHHVLETFKILD